MEDADALNETTCSALANICRVAAVRFREHADRRDSVFESMRQTFVEHVRQAEDFADAFEDRGSRLAMEASASVSAKASRDEIMSLVESYADARRRARDSDSGTYAEAARSVSAAREALEDALADVLGRSDEPAVKSAFRP